MATAETETPAPPEPEQPDQGEPEPDEEPDEDEPAPEEPTPRLEEDDKPLSQKELERLSEKLVNEKRRHTSRISEIMGDDAVALVECEGCDPNIPGWHWPAEVFPVDSPQFALYSLLAGGVTSQPKQPEHLHACQSCNGLGFWLTGGHKAGNETITCSDCGGFSYVDERQHKPAAPAVVAAPVNGGEPAPPPVPTEETDFWGRPIGHPRFGRMPIYLSPAETQEDRAAGYQV